MDEESASKSAGNLTSTTLLLSPDKNVSQDQFHACAVYIMVTFGIVQLFITIVGLVGKFARLRQFQPRLLNNFEYLFFISNNCE